MILATNLIQSSLRNGCGVQCIASLYHLWRTDFGAGWSIQIKQSAPGWGLEFLPNFVAKHQFPNREVWENRSSMRKEAAFEVPCH